MSVDTFVNNPRMMVDMFRSVAVTELTFIQRIAAFMGFLLGLVQVVVYLLLENVHLSDYICQLFLFLPCVSAEKRGIDHCMEH